MNGDSPAWPVLDFDRAAWTADGEREVVQERSPLTVLVDETDAFVDLPIRTVTGPLIGPTLEIGPYSLGKTQVLQLEAHLAAFLTTFRPDWSEQQQ